MGIMNTVARTALPRELVVALVCLLAVVVGSATAFAQALDVYDDFSTSTINPEKWIGREWLSGAAVSTELTRRVRGGGAQILLRAFGGTSTDSGSGGPGAALRIGNPRLVAGDPVIEIMEARLRVVDARVDDCPTSSVSSVVRAQVTAAFFNDGTGTRAAGDRTGDVVASVQKIMTSGGFGKTVKAWFYRCNDASCTSQNVVTVSFDRSWSEGDTDLMRVRWDRANKRFQFVVNAITGGHGNETRFLPYAFAQDSAKPARLYHEIQIYHTVANCTAGPVEALMDLHVDRVRLDEAAIIATRAE